MKRLLILTATLSAIVTGIIMSTYMMSMENKNETQKENHNIDIADKVTDECIEEYDKLENEGTKEANSEEIEKISPNAVIVFKKFYKDCEHTINKQEKIPNSLVNATKEEVEEKYSQWKLQEFSKEKIVLFQELEGECGEHYMLRDVDGKINVYKLDETGNEALLNETEIATEYLTETDKINMENGLIVYGKESLNKLLEDFE